mgnify:CR=1 FL=1|jgi:uncharacterized protein YjbJ (UPF0337 family)
MNKDIIEGNWKVLKGEVQSRWGKLTDDALDQVDGNREKLSGLIQKNYGIAKDEAETQIKDWEKKMRNSRAA